MAGLALLAMAPFSASAYTILVDPNFDTPTIEELPQIVVPAPSVKITNDGSDELCTGCTDLDTIFTANYFLPGSVLEADPGPGPVSQDLEATIIWTIVSFLSTELVLDVSVTNNTDPLLKAAILALGFGTLPNTTGSISPGNVFTLVDSGVGAMQNFAGVQGIDICAFPQNCSGGAINQGLLNGLTDTFTLTLTSGVGFGALPSTMILMTYLPIKWETDEGSFIDTWPCITTNGDCNGSEVPEPGALTLLGAGLAGLALLRRRRRIAA